MADGDGLLIGRDNAGDARTRLIRDGIASNDAFFVQNNNGLGISVTGTVTPAAPGGAGVYAFSRASGFLTASAGVYGESTNGTGVRGESQTNGFGVHGLSFGTAIRGESKADNPGVHGSSARGDGVTGEASGVGVTGEASGVGVTGEYTGDAPGGVGVRGIWPFEGAGRVGAGVFGVIGADLSLPSQSTGAGVCGRSINGPGVYGESAGRPGVHGFSTGSGPGVLAQSAGSQGVFAQSQSATSAAVEGRSPNSPGGPGVFGFSVSGPGVRGECPGGGLAGQFLGDVVVTRKLTANNLDVPFAVRAALKIFRIDHPLDPERKYLQHACVESSEMKTIYDGVITLDESGEAVVELPGWFEALNADLCYQLTAVGGSAPGLHIAEEVSENRFKIAGGEEGMKVCWQVTGNRKDKWAETNPLEVELEKPEEERGRYLHPELFDAPEEQGIYGRPTLPHEEHGRPTEEESQPEEGT